MDLCVLFIELVDSQHQQLDMREHVWSFVGAIGSLLNAKWKSLRCQQGVQGIQFYKDFVSTSVSARSCTPHGTRGCPGSRSCSTYGLHGCILEASWEHRGVLLEVIWSLKVCIFTKVLQALPLLDAVDDAQLQTLATHAP